MQGAVGGGHGRFPRGDGTAGTGSAAQTLLPPSLLLWVSRRLMKIILVVREFIRVFRGPWMSRLHQYLCRPIALCKNVID